MFKRVSLMAAAALLVIASGYANQPSQSNGKVVINVEKVNPTNGKQMYSSYCAPCHGTEGRGNGPAASALKTQPTDLTLLAKANKGKYPENHLTAVLEFGTSLPAHGSAQMPVWGPLLGKISNVHTQEKTLRIANLVRYLETIQAK